MIGLDTHRKAIIIPSEEVEACQNCADDAFVVARMEDFPLGHEYTSRFVMVTTFAYLPLIHNNLDKAIIVNSL